MYAVPALLLTTRQVNELNACWNNVIRRLFGYNKWESVSVLLLSLERLNVKHLIMHRKIDFYKRLLYSSDVFIHNMFCTFLYNNCDYGILLKSVFYRKIWCHSQCLVSLSGLCFMLVCISVILLLYVFLFLVFMVCSLSVSLPDLANKDVHKITHVTAGRQYLPPTRNARNVLSCKSFYASKRTVRYSGISSNFLLTFAISRFPSCLKRVPERPKTFSWLRSC